jgi:hypothetical protein
MRATRDELPILFGDDQVGIRGRRGVLRAVSAMGVALLAALGLGDSTAAAGFRTKRVVSEASAPLGAAAESFVNTFANCNGGKLLSCGHIVDGDAEQLVNAMVIFAAPVEDRTACGAALFRTASAGAAAGATITAVALCRA